MLAQTPTKSEIFSIYNKARKAARQGKLNPAHVNKALGLLLSGKERPYVTTLKTCTCPNWRSGIPCKHQVKRMMEYRIEQERHGKQLQAQASAEALSGRHYVEHNPADISLAEQWTSKTWIEYIFATQEQVQAFKIENPDVTLIATAQARGRKVKFEDHRSDII